MKAKNIGDLEFCSKNKKCWVIATRLNPNIDNNQIDLVISNLLLKSEVEINNLYQDNKSKIYVGDTVIFPHTTSNGVEMVCNGQVITHQDNNLLIQVDKATGIGFKHTANYWAVKNLTPDDKFNLIWVHKKQVKEIIQGGLDNRLEVLDRAILDSNLLFNDPKWAKQLENAKINAKNNNFDQAFKELGNLFADFFKEAGWPEEVFNSFKDIPESEWRLIFEEASILEKEIKQLIQEAEQDKDYKIFNLTQEITDTTIPYIKDSEKKQVYNNDNKTYSVPKEKPIMSDKVKFVDMVKSDGTDAAYRVGAKQMTKAFKLATTNMLKGRGTKKSQINAIGEFLDTEFGESMISMLLGTGLNYMPGISNDPRAKKLAKEFRVEGMAQAGNLVADSVMQYLLPAVVSTLQSLPEEGKIRVLEGKSSKLEEGTEDVVEELEEIKVSTKARA